MDKVLLNERKVYIAGPMTGLPEFNYPAFFAAEEYLRSHGAKVMNPAILPKGFEHHEYMQIAIPMLQTCDVVAFLPGWQQSKGARMEFTKAPMGKRYYYSWMLIMRMGGHGLKRMVH